MDCGGDAVHCASQGHVGLGIAECNDLVSEATHDVVTWGDDHAHAGNSVSVG
jgi:hypothetical protein